MNFILEKEKTASDVSVGADTKQSILNSSGNSISDFTANCKDADKMYEEIEKDFLRRSDPSYLETKTLNQLYEETYIQDPSIVANLLFPGTYIFAGTPKVGKSFLMAQLAYHISTGLPLWNFPTRQGTVLYFALEDTFGRLQRRMYRMVGESGNDKLHFAISSHKLGKGLEEQLSSFVSKHKDTKLIIIDTMKKIEEGSKDNSNYGKDYDLISDVKSIADKNGICIVIVHHTRKQSAEDIFDMISGTNGLFGAADGSFVMCKEKRGSDRAILHIVGRDQPDQKITLLRNKETLGWDMETAETENWDEPQEPVLSEIAKIITKENPIWQGSPTELTALLQTSLKPNSLSLKLNVNAGILLNDFNILYENKRSHEGRRITLTYAEK